MNKPNYLYAIIGLLAGLIFGYVGTNYINQTSRPTETAASSTTLPPDHPPTDGTMGGASGAAGGDSSGAAQSSETMSGGSIKWTKPARWKDGPPKQMRTATYMIPAAPGDGEEAECSVFRNIGGGVQANIARWVGQFETTAEAPIQKQDTINGLVVTTVTVSGTFKGGGAMMGQSGGPKSSYRLLGAIAQGPEGEIYFKLTGPAKTVAAAQGEFEAMLKSLKN
ncbi:MAG TPA: hypothetical protein VFS27_08020 [Blastocatellia bacterium]|jgi:hypothetical protein|nr:hypothetical protein [Blastocatellia bacterium]